MTRDPNYFSSLIYYYCGHLRRSYEILKLNLQLNLFTNFNFFMVARENPEESLHGFCRGLEKILTNVLREWNVEHREYVQ